jgi:hypothetical protein
MNLFNSFSSRLLISEIDKAKPSAFPGELVSHHGGIQRVELAEHCRNI